MKRKEYISPVTNIVGVTRRTPLLAGSPGVGISSAAADKDGEVLSRQGSAFWDDEEDF
ncbi:MAG: hypothetical protein IJ637_05975 [Prevotella sp.]|nr:hypothetical protein [Prevotella sp.]